MEDIPTVIVKDARLMGVAKPTMVVSKGPASVTYQRVTPANPASVNPSFTIDMPSVYTGLGRHLMWHAEGSFVITGTDLNRFRDHPDSQLCLRQFPLQSMCTSIEVAINNDSITLANSQAILAALLRVGNPTNSRSGIQSAVGSADDNLSVYADYAGRNDSPFRLPTDAAISDYSSPSRTIGITDVQVNVGNTELTVFFSISEPLVVSPFSYTEVGSEKAIYGCSNIKVNLNMSNFHRGLSWFSTGGATVTGVNLNLTQQELFCEFITPDTSSIEIAKAEATVFGYDYTQVSTYFKTIGGTIAPRASSNGVSSNSFQLPVVPSKLLIFAIRSSNDMQNPALSLTSSFLPITSLQVSAGTRAGLLAGSSEVDLWRMSHKNGAKIPYFTYSGQPLYSSEGAIVEEDARPTGAGGPIVIDVAADLSLDEGLVPGMVVSWQFSVSSATIYNNQKVDVTDAQLVVVALTEGAIVNESGATSRTTGIGHGPDGMALEKATEMMSDEYHTLMQMGGYGGRSKFLNWLKKAGKTILHFAAPVVRAVAPEFAPAVSAIQRIAGAGSLGGGTLGGASLGGAALGGRLVGGRRARGSMYM